MSDLSMEPLSPISKEFLQAFYEDSLIIDLPSIKLQRLDENNPEIYTGKGFLRIRRDHNFEMRVYADKNEDYSKYLIQSLKRLQLHKSGEIIPRSEYFRLESIDINGSSWYSEQVEISLSASQHGTVIVGTLQAPLINKTTSLSSTPKAKIRLRFFNDLPVHYSGVRFTQASEGGQPVDTQVEENHETFPANNYEITIRKVDPELGSTVLIATSKDEKLHPAIELRLEEALSYVTASKVRWALCEKRIGTSREITIIPRSELNRSFLEPPLHHKGQTSNDFWQLFGKYFEFILPYSSEDAYHPLSLQIYHVVNGSARDLSLIALVVSIAIEGVLKVCFEDLAKPQQSFIASLEKVKSLIDRLKCADESLKGRIKGSLDQMKQSRAKDRLKLLVEQGIITKEQTKTWDKLRNASAHADKNFAPEKVQELALSCHIVHVMMHRLVFQAIDYSGQYVNYGTVGWPTENFEAKSLG